MLAGAVYAGCVVLMMGLVTLAVFILAGTAL